MSDTDARIQAERHEQWLADIQKRRDAMYGTDEAVTPDPTMGRRMEEAPDTGEFLAKFKDGAHIILVRSKPGLDRFEPHFNDEIFFRPDEFRCWWDLSALKVPDWAKKGGA